MSASGKRILVVDDEQDIREGLRRVLEYEGYVIRLAASGAEALASLAAHEVDLIFLDVKMPGMDGLDVLEALGRQGVKAPVVMISGHGTIETACQALRAGAYDFIEKPPPLDKILSTVRNALESRRLAEENRELRLKFEERYRLVGTGTEMSQIHGFIRKAAPTNATVLITGESGTGKELVARAIHRNSKRGSMPFIRVNCAAIPESLIESELFGHEKGSFTGAVEKQIGKFVQANEGTIFLDEIGDMSLATQAKVLRVLQESEVEPVGAGRVLRVDVRVIAATNKDLAEEIEAGRFREDLFFRLNVVPIRVTPLRERREDIPLLVAYFVEALAAENGVPERGVGDDLLAALSRYSWKGNVRELRNTIERMLILSDRDVMSVDDLPDEIRRSADEPLPSLGSSRTLREFKEASERSFLVQRLRDNEWNISSTAQAVETPRSNLYKKMEAYEINREKDG